MASRLPGVVPGSGRISAAASKRVDVDCHVRSSLRSRVLQDVLHDLLAVADRQLVLLDEPSWQSHDPQLPCCFANSQWNWLLTFECMWNDEVMLNGCGLLRKKT